MAATCAICQKGVQYGHNVSHAKNRTRRVFLPNLREAKIRVNGVVQKMKVCMKCLKRAKLDGVYVLTMATEKRSLTAKKTETPKIEQPTSTVKKSKKTSKTSNKTDESATIEAQALADIIGKK